MRVLIITFLLAFSQISFAAPVENDEQLIKDGIKITLGYLMERESIDPNLIFTDHIFPICISKLRCEIFFKILRSKFTSDIAMDPVRIEIFKATASKIKQSFDFVDFYRVAFGLTTLSSLFLLKEKKYKIGFLLALLSAVAGKKAIDQNAELGELKEPISNMYNEIGCMLDSYRRNSCNFN